MHSNPPARILKLSTQACAPAGCSTALGPYFGLTWDPHECQLWPVLDNNKYSRCSNTHTLSCGCVVVHNQQQRCMCDIDVHRKLVAAAGLNYCWSVMPLLPCVMLNSSRAPYPHKRDELSATQAGWLSSTPCLSCCCHWGTFADPQQATEPPVHGPDTTLLAPAAGN